MIKQRWTKSDEEMLRKHYPTHLIEFIAALLNRTPGAIQIKIIRMGIPPNNPHWTQEEENILRNLYPTGSHKQLVASLHKSIKNISSQAYRLGIHRVGIGSKQKVENRFENFIMPEPNGGCWLWMGKTNKVGYGSISDKKGKRKMILAHRLSWEIHNGPIPEGLDVLHHCDTPSCVNPQHLFLGTDQDNKDDCCKKKRQAYGSRNGNAKLTDDDVIKIRQDMRSIREIAISFGISRWMTYQIRNNISWKHISNPSLP